jgi:uncharacterized protein (DUF849 family)
MTSVSTCVMSIQGNLRNVVSCPSCMEVERAEGTLDMRSFNAGIRHHQRVNEKRGAKEQWKMEKAEKEAAAKRATQQVQRSMHRAVIISLKKDLEKAKALQLQSTTTLHSIATTKPPPLKVVEISGGNARFDNVVMMDNNKMAFGGAEHFSLSPPLLSPPINEA